MRNFEEELENYQKNLWCLQRVTDRLLDHMKGYDYSFRPDITKGGKFSEERLRALMEELLSCWEKKLRLTDTDPAAGESLAEPWIRERRELYGVYLYLAMRCSLVQGAFQARGGSEKERTDFSFLLEQARQLSRSWCIMEEPGQGRKNALLEGYDNYFGLHLYHPLVDPENRSNDFALTPMWKVPQDHLDLMTNEGNMKRMFIRHLRSASPAVEEAEPEEAAEEPKTAEEEPAAEEYDDWEDEGGDYDFFEDLDLDDPWAYEKAMYDEDYLDIIAAEYEYLEEQGSKTYLLQSIAQDFEGKEEYLSACRRFVELFEQAGPEVLRGFSDDLDEIVSVFLVERGISLLTDTDKTLDIYSRIFEGPYRQAKRYARGMQWKNM